MIFTEDTYDQQKFTDLLLDKQALVEIEFEDCEFSNCSFVETKINHSKFINCRFTNCLLSAINLNSSHFIETHFLESKVIGVDWTKAGRIDELKFNNCQLNYSNFRQLKIPQTEIINCEATEVDFSETDLSQSNFANTDLTKSLFLKTNLTKANFEGAKNYYIDVKNNTLKGAIFSLPEAINLLHTLDVKIKE